ncbi:cdc42 effector protein 3-like [Rhinichthys klamathensis goyatoka]|uniref:cdc42 effector protein 3-like n=1 Tax=Rhinichthys klamathensis goyatoka TaxID=3034132 RepID=UPI0024B5CADD|nr:cdc42 effector protein 3-like [Rhinichthys klamathensis goyatoka]
MPLRTSLHRRPASGRWRLSSRKEVVSMNMISLPLADFRHLSHIGVDGHTESFGDLSFLKEGRSLLLQSSRSEQNLFLTSGPPPKPPRISLEEDPIREHGPGTRSGNPVREHTRRQKCSSLPLLDVEEEEDECVESRGMSIIRSPARGSLSSGRDSTQTNPEETQRNEPEETDQTDAEFTFSLDLGPSILDSVLQVMEKVQL